MISKYQSFIEPKSEVLSKNLYKKSHTKQGSMSSSRDTSIKNKTSIMANKVG